MINNKKLCFLYCLIYIIFFNQNLIAINFQEEEFNAINKYFKSETKNKINKELKETTAKNIKLTFQEILNTINEEKNKLSNILLNLENLFLEINNTKNNNANLNKIKNKLQNIKKLISENLNINENDKLESIKEEINFLIEFIELHNTKNNKPTLLKKIAKAAFGLTAAAATIIGMYYYKNQNKNVLKFKSNKKSKIKHTQAIVNSTSTQPSYEQKEQFKTKELKKENLCKITDNKKPQPLIIDTKKEIVDTNPTKSTSQEKDQYKAKDLTKDSVKSTITDPETIKQIKKTKDKFDIQLDELINYNSDSFTTYNKLLSQKKITSAQASKFSKTIPHEKLKDLNLLFYLKDKTKLKSANLNDLPKELQEPIKELLQEYDINLE